MLIAMKKSNIYKENGVNLASKVSPEIADAFRSQARSRRQPIKYALAAAAKLWTELPPEIQARLLDQSLSTDGFITIVRQIADEQIEAGRKAARVLIARHRQKPTRKGRGRG